MLVLVVTAGMITNSVYAQEEGNDIIWVGKKSYGCNNKGAQWNFKDGTLLQTVGQSSLNGTNRGYNKRYLCNAKGITYDDHWDIKDTKWCDDSEVKQAGIAGVDYVLIGPDGTNYGSAGAAADGGCIKGIKNGGDAGKDATSPSDSTSLISETTSGGKPAVKPTTPKPSVGGSSKSGAAGVRDACYATTSCGARNALQKLAKGDQMALAVLVGGGLALSPVGHVVAGAMGTPAAAGLLAAGLGVGGGVLALKALSGNISISSNSNEYIFFDDGTCLECDTYEVGEHYECPNGTIVWNGGKAYSCHTTDLGDYWGPKTLYPCNNSPIKDLNAKGVLVDIDASVEKTVANSAYVFSNDACLMIYCPDGFKYDKASSTCVSVNIEDGQPGDGNNGGGKKPDDGNNGGGKKPGGGNNGGGKKPDDGNNGGGKKPGDGNNGGGTKPEGELYSCPSEKLEQLTKWKQDCKDESAILSQISVVETVCANSNSTESEFNIAWMGLVGLNPDGCLKRAEAAVAVAAGEEIEDAVLNIRSLTAGLEQSAWKNEEGKFNTARLASDSIAGVVLGTAGGLITSHVVKKHQVKEGFEDIKCTIGGQNVAGWGDEFSVGVQ